MKGLTRTPFSRRRWLQSASWILSSSIAGSSDERASEQRSATVGVLGAGMAGLAAAHHLQKAGVDCLVVEGRDRSGGRIYSDSKTFGIPIDLGASWLHGIGNNPLFPLSKTWGIATAPTTIEDHNIIDSRGVFLPTRKSESIQQWGESFLEEICDERDPEEKDRPLADAIEEKWRSQFGKRETKTQSAPGSVSRSQANYALSLELEKQYGADAKDLSLLQFDRGAYFRGEDHFVKDGMQTLVEQLRKGLAIHQGTIVKSVIRQKKRVIVGTSNGDYTFEKVLITFPLGVLKSDDIQFFPAIPRYKRDAWHRLGMGSLEKTILEFDRPFWPQDKLWFGMLAEEAVPTSNLFEVLNLMPLVQRPILMGFLAGTVAAQRHASLSNEQLQQLFLHQLRLMFPGSSANVTNYTASHWTTDPFSRGSYSYMAVHSTEQDVADYIEPVDKQLYFAGEATSEKFPSTVHGAFLSGLRESNRILKE